MTNFSNKVMYVGVTSDLEKRVAEHKSCVIEGFTKKYNVVKLVYFEAFESIVDAIEREKQIKGWARHKKNALVEEGNPKWRDLTQDWI